MIDSKESGRWQFYSREGYGTTSLALIKTCLMALCLMPFLAVAEPKVMVDSIPTGAALFNVATVKFPYSDLDKVDSKDVEADIASAIASAMQSAEQNAVTYISLLSTAGDNARTFTFGVSHDKLKLQRINPRFVMVLYSGGRDTTGRITYTVGNGDSHRRHISMTFKKVSVPVGWTTDAWVYFNLSRIQDEACKVGTTQIFLQSGGTGMTTPVIVPGSGEPLMVFGDETTISATWYVEDANGKSVSPR